MSSSWLLSGSTLTSENLDSVFLVDWLLALFASITIIFYFNRYIGTILSFILRLYVWNKYKVRIKIKAVKVSLLGGRVFFKNLTVITENETVSMLQGTFTWRYWLNTTRMTEFELDESDKDKSKNESLPTRFILQVYGLEVFMYNRVYAYENLMDFINKSDAKSEETNSADRTSGMSSETFRFETKSSSPEFPEEVPSEGGADDELSKPMEIKFLSMLNSFPITTQIKKGAVVIGNKTTSSILVLAFAQGDGLVDISKSENKLDQFKTTFRMNFVNPKVMLKPNVGYVEHESKKKTEPLRRRDLEAMRHKRFDKTLQILRRLSTILRLHRSNDLYADKEENAWRGLKQYVEASTEAGTRVTVNHDEYAKYSEILDAEALYFCYYYDKPGKVPQNPESTAGQQDINNGGSAPVYGAYFSVSRGVIHYGPWANRERVGLQRMLFPTACRDAKPHEKLSPGNQRKYTSFKLEVNVADEVTLRIPFREFSKNTKVESEADNNVPEIDEDTRPPFGWIEIRAAKDTTLISETSYIPTVEHGWDNKLHLDLTKPEIRSSTNHDILFRAAHHTLQAEIGFPLEWNGLTHWQFHNRADASEIFLLREHITLVSDMMSDFSFGPPTPYELFKPFIYDVDIDFAKGYKLYLNINDNNIINNPLDFNDNVYLSFQGDLLSTKVNIPMTTIVKKTTCVSYELSTDHFNLVLHAPPWHTLNNFLKSNTVGISRQFAIDGSYTYASVVEPNIVDTIVIDCTCEETVLELYGFVLRYALIVKENYFGIHKIFKTLQEYTDDLSRSEEASISTGSESTNKKPVKRKHENELDLMFSFALQGGCCILPSNVYDCDSNVSLYFETLDVDIRYTNYYMDLQCDLSRIDSKFSTYCDSITLIEEALKPKFKDLESHMVIDKFTAHGHRMFGLPPLEPTYFCKWDLKLGKVDLQSRAEFLTVLGSSLKNLKFAAKDTENLLVAKPVILNDIVVLTLECPEIFVSLQNADGSKVHLSLFPVELNFNDMANDRYSKRLNVKIPVISLKILGPQNETLGSVGTSVYITNFVQKKDFENEFKLQQEHIYVNDAPFHRLPFFIAEDRMGEYRKKFGAIKPSFSIPPVAPPLNAQSVDFVFDELPFERSENDFVWNIIPPDAKSENNSIELSATEKSYYNNSDYSPTTGPDPNFEHDNLILNFDAITGFVDFKSVDVVTHLLDDINTFTLESVMDSLHVNTIKGLKLLADDLSTVINVRLVLSKLELKVGYFSDIKATDEFAESGDHMEILLQNVSAALSTKTTKTLRPALRLIDRVISVKESTSALHIRELTVNAGKGGSSKAFASSLSDIEFWSNDTMEDGITTSANIRSHDTSIDSDELIRFADFFNTLATMGLKTKSRLKEIFQRKGCATSELLYAISTAGVNHRIEYDPAVLTKPAYIMRSSNNHIRSNDSWKVVVRLRHIMQHLPRTWLSETRDMFRNHSWSTDENACNTVLNIFKNWRSWEFSDISRCYLFDQVFKIPFETEPILDKTSKTKINVAFETISVTLNSAEKESDYIYLDFLNCCVITEDSVIGNAALGVDDFEGSSCTVIFSAESVRDNISPLSLKVKDFVDHLDFSSATAEEQGLSGKSDTQQNSALKTLFTISALVNKVEHRITFEKTSIVSTGRGFTLSVLAIAQSRLHDQLPFNVVMGTEHMSYDVFLMRDSVGTLTCKDGTVFVSNTGTLKTGLKNVVFSLSEMNLKCDEGTDNYVTFIDTVINSEIAFVKNLISNIEIEGHNGNATPRPKREHSMSEFASCPVLISTSIEKIAWDVEMLSPVKFVGHMNGLLVASHVMKDVLICNFDIHSLIANTYSARHAVKTIALFKTEVSKFQMLTKFLLADDYNLLNVFVKTDRAVITIPQLLETIISSCEDKVLVMESIAKFKKVLTQSVGDEPVSPVKTEVIDDTSLSKKKPLLSKIFVVNNYSGLVTHVGSELYRLDTRNSSLSQFNYSLTESREVSQVKPYGEMLLPASRLMFGNSIDEFTVLGVNLAVKVMNPDNIDHKLQTLQVELRYFRLFLTPHIVTQFILLQRKCSTLFRNFASAENKASEPVSSTAYEKGSILGFYSIHILAYNICLGWIFSNPNSRSKGVIFGCERIFVVSEEKVGKLTLVDAYMSLAKGSTPSSFFSESGEFDAPNRAFLPNMQYIYAILSKDGKRKVHATVSGEQLDVRFAADGVNVIEEVFKSIDLSKQMLNRAGLPSEQRQSERQSTLESVSIERAGFHSIECITSFAGAKVVIYNNDSDCFEDCSSFTLQSPAVKIAAEYVHFANAKKKHDVKIEIITSASKNILFASCVPVLNNLYHAIKKMMGSTISAAGETTQSKEIEDVEMSSQSTIFDDVNLNLGICIEPQEIALSCEPTAKVQATASCKSIDLRVGTCEQVAPSIWSVLKLEGFAASLQHVYSRETSGSIDIDHILIAGFYNNKGEKKLATSAYVSEVQTLVNVKQLQDLDLFRDIWIPKDLVEEPEARNEATSKRITRRAEDISSMNELPWIIDVLVLNANCTVDMGKSLGILNLNMNRLWASSKRSVTWEQNLRFAIDKFALTSEGRLGGEVSMVNLTAATAISWVVNDKVYEHPLVMISAAVESVQSKSSLDFHTFFVCNIKKLALNIFNKRGKSSSAHDSLFATADVDSLKVYFTALAASNFWDIYNTASRIHSDIRISYKEVLKDSSNKASKVMLKKIDQTDESLSRLIDALTTNLDVRIGQVLVHVYPNSLMDSQVLVFNLGEAHAKFYQNTATKLENKLTLKLTDFVVSLSGFQNKIGDENTFKTMSIDEFFQNSKEVKGGTIFVFPSMLINMDIWQAQNSNLVEYKYHSSFGGKVDIRWNLGSVNFIRDMWTSHANALSSRLESHRRIKAKNEIEMKVAGGDKSFLETVNLEDKLKDVEMGSKYRYIAVSPLIAEAPQLKELGDATPPLEWFGLHRTKFPNMTHQMIIVSLQKMVHEVETQYGRILR